MFKYTVTTKVLNEFGINVVNRAKGNLRVYGFGGQQRNRKKESTGALGEGLFHFIESTPNGIVIEFLSQEEYASVVENGRGANKRMAPVEVFVRWIKEKPVRLKEPARRDNTGRLLNPRTVGRFVEMNDRNIRSAAYAMAKSQSKKGTPGIKFMWKAFIVESKKITEPMLQAMVTDVEDFILKNFKGNAKRS